MDDQLPAEVDEVDDGSDYPKQAKQMFAKLAKVVNQHSVDRTRYRKLVLFEKREKDLHRPRPISQVEHYDIPQTELILHHRDQIVRLESLIESMKTFLEDKIKDGTLENPLDHMQEVTKWEKLQMKHLEMMEDLLDNWKGDITDNQALMAKLAADHATLTQKMAEHRDKMELANKSAMMPSDTEMKQRLAHKYGITVQEVEAMMSAKLVEHEQG